MGRLPIPLCLAAIAILESVIPRRLRLAGTNLSVAPSIFLRLASVLGRLPCRLPPRH